MFLTAVKPLNSLQRSRVSITKSSVIPEARPAVLPVRGPKSPPCYIVVCLRNRWHVSTPLSNFPPSMSVFYAAAPVLTAVLLILGLRQSAVRAGFAGLLAAFLVVWLVPGFHLAAQPLGAALAYGGLTTLVVSYVLLGGVVLYQVMRTGGALGRIAGSLAGAIPDPGRRVLVLVLGLSVFFESLRSEERRSGNEDVCTC